MNSKIFFLGPNSNFITGQSIAFSKIYNYFDDSRKFIVNTKLTNNYGVIRVIDTVLVLIKSIYKSIFTNYDTLYFTCSRSIHGSMRDILIINIIKLKNKNIKIINHLHGSDLYSFIESCPNWYKSLLINSYKKIDYSIVPNINMIDQFSHIPNTNVVEVKNFYDNDLKKIQFDKNNNILKIVYFSNIVASKGIFELIDSFKKISKIYVDVQLDIAGDFVGDEIYSKEVLKKIFFKKILNEPRIKYHGICVGIDKVKLLQQSDILVLASYYRSEAIPISIIEAMVCRNVIITSNYKYLKFLISKKNGILVDVKSTKDIVQAMIYFIENKKILRKIQKRNRLEALKLYNPEDYLIKLNKILVTGN